MAQAIPAAWTSEGLHPGLPPVVESAGQEKIAPKRARRFFAARVDSIASSDSSGMPPIVQFAMHGIAWCRTKLKGGSAGVAAPLRLVGQLPLGGKRSLSLVEADGLRFLVGGSLDSVTVIVPVIVSVSGAECPARQEAPDARGLVACRQPVGAVPEP